MALVLISEADIKELTPLLERYKMICVAISSGTLFFIIDLYEKTATAQSKNESKGRLTMDTDRGSSSTVNVWTQMILGSIHLTVVTFMHIYFI